jgi:predicted Zn finger-like uncharacterized protein
MKIVCDSCSTKYSISDDKVRGKVFKIRCKKCSHIIVVRGTGDAPAAAEAAGDAVWHLVVDGDQVGPLTDVEIRARLARGEITAENYVWKEGFSDWLRLVDVPEFADVGGAAPLGNELFSDSALAAKSGQVDLAAVAEAEAPTIAAPPAEEQAAFFGAGAAGQEARASTRSTSGRTRAAAAASEEDAFSLPAATPARGSDSADLFGMAPVTTQAESGRVKTRNTNGAGGGAARHDGGRVENLTAQRSENSVLFSLSNLQSLAAPPVTKSSGTPTTEGSGLIDIRAMAASTLKSPSASPGQIVFGGGGGGSTTGADDLPAFGAFSSAAPVLFPIPTSSGPPKWLYALIAGAAISLVVVVWAAFSVLRKPVIVEQPVQPVVIQAPPPAAPAAAPARRTVAENELPPREKEETAGEKAGGEKSGGEKAAPKSTGHHTKTGKKGGEKGEKAGGSDAKSGESAAAPAAPSDTDKPKAQRGSLDDLLEGALNNRGKARARSGDDDSGSRRGGGESAGGGGPLAKSAVVAGMNGVKGKVANCYNQYKVPGMAMVNVVISKSGKVTSANVTGKFAGTPTGSCVEAAVKTASFPPSDGLSTPYPFNLR